MRSKNQADKQRLAIANAVIHGSHVPHVAIFEAIMELCRTIEDVGERLESTIGDLERVVDAIKELKE